jgi:pre-mRNA-processing factor 40
MESFLKILVSLPITKDTLWKDAKVMLKSSEEYINSENLLEMDALDHLTVFEDRIKDLEKDWDKTKLRERDLKRRSERKNREAYKVTLY